MKMIDEMTAAKAMLEAQRQGIPLSMKVDEETKVILERVRYIVNQSGGIKTKADLQELIGLLGQLGSKPLPAGVHQKLQEAVFQVQEDAQLAVDKYLFSQSPTLKSQSERNSAIDTVARMLDAAGVSMKLPTEDELEAYISEGERDSKSTSKAAGSSIVKTRSDEITLTPLDMNTFQQVKTSDASHMSEKKITRHSAGVQDIGDMLESLNDALTEFMQGKMLDKFSGKMMDLNF